MRYLKRLVWAAAVVVGTATPGFAQITGGTTGGGTGGLGGTGGTGGTGGLGGTGGTGGMGGGGQGGSGQNLSSAQDAALANALIAPPTGQLTNSVLSASNFLAPYYSNPYWMGQPGSGTSQSPGGQGPGGFGNPLYNMTTTGGGARGGAAGGRAGLTGLGGGRAGGFGGGLGGAQSTSGMLVALPVQISYPSIPHKELHNSTPPLTAPQLQSDISGMLARSVGTIANPAGIQVLTDGNTVTLRGAVKDVDEARLIEGMVRLTPGVRMIRNELTFPAEGR